MKFTYQDKQYELVGPKDWTTLEAMQLQKITGRAINEVMKDLSSPTGVHGTAWISLRRAGVDVEWDSLELPYIDTVRSLEDTEPAAAKARK